MSNKLTYLLLSIVIAIAIAARFFKLDVYPPSITWDEAAVGYNAYTIINWGKDEWGKTLPLTFKSFGDDKNPVHVYLTAAFVAVFGLNDFAVRASAATFGVLNVIVIFFLSRILFKSNGLGLISSIFLAVSPFNIQFSRFNHELNFAIFFFSLGIYFIYKTLSSEKGKFLIPAFLFLGIDLLTYQSAKVVTPPLVALLILINFKELLKYKKYLITGVAIYSFFISLLFIKPELLGGERLKQNPIPKEQIAELGLPRILINRYLMYFQKDFLFVTGDTNPRHSIQTFGTFYWFEFPLLIIGALGILYGLVLKKNKQMLFLISWVLIAPIPAVASSEMPHVARAMFLTVSWTMISAYGAYLLINLFQNKFYKSIVVVTLLAFLSCSAFKYLKSYYQEYSQKYAIEWVYGMKEIVKFIDRNDYFRNYMTNVRMQPYIFFLYYLQTPLPDYLETVKYNETQSRPSSLVAGFEKYRFQWDEIQSLPDDAVLYAVSPSIYGGLAYRQDFEVLKLIKYPNGSDAFYLVTKKY